MARFSPMSRGCCPALAIHFVCLFALALAAGCSGSSTDTVAVACSGGVLCPEDATCTADGLGCTTTSCGNGVVDGGEQCDDGNLSDDDGCSAPASWRPAATARWTSRPVKRATRRHRLRDRRRATAPAPSPSAATARPTRPAARAATTARPVGDLRRRLHRSAACGDGVVNVPAASSATTATPIDTDACRNDLHSGGAAATASSGPGEECDDGNARRHRRLPQRPASAAACGDGVVQRRRRAVRRRQPRSTPTPAATPAHRRPAATASSTPAPDRAVRRRQPGRHRRLPRRPAQPAACGDGVSSQRRRRGVRRRQHHRRRRRLHRRPAPQRRVRRRRRRRRVEQCDDGNTTDDGDGCSPRCQRSRRCGDGVVQAASRSATTATRCRHRPTAAAPPACGRRLRRRRAPVAVEECDDGNSTNGDTCVTGCRLNVCGDGYRDDAGPRIEPCDDGNGSNTDDCVTVFGGNCAVAACGDGFIDVYGPRTEACNPGSPGAPSRRATPTAGPAVRRRLVNAAAGEVCDTGTPGGCIRHLRPDCTQPLCGDGGSRSGRRGLRRRLQRRSCGACNADCTGAGTGAGTCGDGIICASAGEVCDDGSQNGQPGNACGATCKRANGQMCTLGGECGSGNCVDGYCCNATCGGLCEACAWSKSGGANGVCADIPTGTDPDNECAGTCQANASGVNTCS